MFQQLKKRIQKRVHPFVILGVSLFAVMAITAWGGLLHHRYELSHQARTAPAAITAVETENNLVAIQVSAQPADIEANSSPKTQTTHSKEHQVTPTPPGNNTNPAPAPTPPLAVPQPTSVTISLYVNDSFKGSLTLPSTATQCDALSRALEAGLIQSLDMRYSPQYKTYAVYQINDQGDSGVIWWVYTVNGKSPPYGCSATKVQQGDAVNWDYIKE